jgi:hypothetical protein
MTRYVYPVEFQDRDAQTRQIVGVYSSEVKARAAASEFLARRAPSLGLIETPGDCDGIACVIETEDPYAETPADRYLNPPPASLAGSVDEEWPDLVAWVSREVLQ